MSVAAPARQTRATTPIAPRDADGRARVIVESVRPAVDGGRFAAKRVIGDAVDVEADIFADGHDRIAAVLEYRPAGDGPWRSVRMKPLVNDRWRGTFTVDRIGAWEFRVSAAIDHFGTWRYDLRKKFDAGQDVGVDLLTGAALLEGVPAEAGGADGERLAETIALLRDTGADQSAQVEAALDERVLAVVEANVRRPFAVTSTALPLWVDRARAGFSTWYEMFPRSAGRSATEHGTFDDVAAHLPRLAAMGFDVLYLPPIHPIGEQYRKGRNNALNAGPNDVGSPWAIGGPAGGHKSVHPELGTLDDFDRLIAAANEHGIEIALDIAFQCSPDHPYVREHSEWFRKRPDGTIQYAENPPKKYQDIYPFDFETDAWESLWAELRSIFDFWIDHGVKIFRVDNPHTKSLRFWEWCVNAIREEHPEVIFLSEAFTRPKLMYRLAKLGYTQSYTYFAWRNHPWEIEQYFTELTQTEVVDFFRPNAWPNTPDILNEYLQTGGRPAHVIRLILAATLTSNYGVYGPPFEVFEAMPREPGSEEYLDSEKYQIRHWDFDRPDSLREIITRINRVRRQNPALQQDRTLRFHHVNNPAMVAYSKTSADGHNVILTIVNTNPHRTEAGTVSLDMAALGLDDAEHLHGHRPYQVHDLITGARYWWTGVHNYVRLDPGVSPAHVFRVRRHERTEANFEYFT